MYVDNYDYNYDDMMILFVISYSHLNCHFCTRNTRTLRCFPLPHSNSPISIIYFPPFFLPLCPFSFSSFLLFYTSTSSLLLFFPSSTSSSSLLPSSLAFPSSLLPSSIFPFPYRRHSDRRDGAAQTRQHSTRCKYIPYIPCCVRY